MVNDDTWLFATRIPVDKLFLENMVQFMNEDRLNTQPPIIG